MCFCLCMLPVLYLFDLYISNCISKSHLLNCSFRIVFSSFELYLPTCIFPNRIQTYIFLFVITDLYFLKCISRFVCFRFRFVPFVFPDLIFFELYYTSCLFPTYISQFVPSEVNVSFCNYRLAFVDLHFPTCFCSFGLYLLICIFRFIFFDFISPGSYFSD